MVIRVGHAAGGSKGPAAGFTAIDEGSRSARMKGKSNPRLLIGTAFGVSLGLAIAVLSIKGTDTKSIGRAMQLTAR